VISVTDAITHDFKTKYQGLSVSRFLTITNGFEGEANAPAARAPRQRQVFLHLGSLYFDRGIEGFCRAVAKLIAGERLARDSVRFLFVGGISTEILAAAEREVPELLAEKIIEFRPRVPYEEGQRILGDADI